MDNTTQSQATAGKVYETSTAVGAYTFVSPPVSVCPTCGHCPTCGRRTWPAPQIVWTTTGG